MTDLVGFGYRRSREHDPTSGVDADTNVSPRPVLLRRSDVATRAPSPALISPILTDRPRHVLPLARPLAHHHPEPSMSTPTSALARPHPPAIGTVSSSRLDVAALADIATGLAEAEELWRPHVRPRHRRAGPRPSARLSGVRGVAARLDARAIGRPPRPRRRQRGVRRRRRHAHRDLVHRRRRPHLGSHRARRRRRRPGGGGRRARRRQPLGPQRHEHPRLLSPADVDGVLRVVGARPPGCPRAHLVGRAGADPTARRPPRRPVPPPPRPRRRAPPRDGADER